MDEIQVGDARDITRELSTRLLTMFEIFRSAHPNHLKYLFKASNFQLNNEPLRELPDILRKDELGQADLDYIFDGSNRADMVQGNENFVLLRNYAQDIAETTYRYGKW